MENHINLSDEPTDQNLEFLLTGLLEARFTREQVFKWFKTMSKKHLRTYPGTSSFQAESRDGEFICHSMYFLLDKGIIKNRSSEEYYIRDSDIREYLECLQKKPCNDYCGPISRYRAHEAIPSKEPVNELILLETGIEKLLSNLSILLVRGCYDDLALRKGVAFIKFNDSIFGLNHYHDPPSDAEEAFSIQGRRHSENDLSSLLVTLGISQEDILWFNNDALGNECELWRLDDNGNEYRMETYDNRVKAELTRLEYESKGHKQTYFLKDAPFERSKKGREIREKLLLLELKGNIDFDSMEEVIDTFPIEIHLEKDGLGKPILKQSSVSSRAGIALAELSEEIQVYNLRVHVQLKEFSTFVGSISKFFVSLDIVHRISEANPMQDSNKVFISHLWPKES